MSRRKAPVAACPQPFMPLPPMVNSGIRVKRILMGTPSLGQIRMEWHSAVQGMIVPCNWASAALTPLGFLTADGQNLIAHEALKQEFEWVFFLEDDVVPPAEFALILARHIERADTPIISGVYNLKGSRPPEPLIYRGRGNGCFRDWKKGDQVWVDGVPTGCLLVHSSIFKALAKIRPQYTVQSSGQTIQLTQFFETPRYVFTDPQSKAYVRLIGTSDLYFCDMVIERGILAKAGWPAIGRRKYPFLVDTNLSCGHIDRETGAIW